MNIESELKKASIEVVYKLDTLTVNSIAKSVSHRIAETFSELDISENTLFSKLSKLNMYKAKMPNGMAEANYFYKNSSIYFNEHILDEDLEEFAIHECIHHLQEIKDENNNIIKMGLCDLGSYVPSGEALNEAAVQYMSSIIIGIAPDYEKYYDISLYTPSPSYYPLECALLNEILQFIDKNILFKSTLYSTDNFKTAFIEKTSEHIFNKVKSSFDKLLKLEEDVIKLNNRISLLEDGNNSKLSSLTDKLNKTKHKVAEIFISTQNLIIKSFFDNEFEKISNLEELENFRRKLYKYSNIIGSVKNYNFFDKYYAELMNKLENKFYDFENSQTEKSLSIKSNNFFYNLILKIKSLLFA